MKVFTACLIAMLSLFAFLRPLEAKTRILEGVESNLTFSWHGPEDYDWQAVLGTDLPIISFEGNRRLTFGLAGTMQSVGNNNYGQTEMLRDINYQLMPELTFEGKELRRVKLFLNHWSFHKVDKVQGRASEINLVGAEFRVSPAFSKNGDDYVFFQIRTQILHNSALKNERPLAFGARFEIPLKKSFSFYTTHVAEFDSKTLDFYQGEFGLKAATKPGSGLELFGGWNNGANKFSTTFGAVVKGPFLGVRFRW